MNEKELMKDVIAAVELWLAGGKHRSLSGLAKRCNVAYSTVRRIMQNESAPHPYTVLAMLDVIMPVNERVAFLKKHFPSIGSLMDDVYAQGIRGEPNAENLGKYLSREPHNRLFNMAATQAGISEEAVLRLAGQIGMEAIDEMIKDEVLIRREDGRFAYTHNNWAIGNIDDALEQVRHSVDHFDRSLVGTPGAGLVHVTGAIKKEKLPELRSLLERFVRDINQLKDHPEAEGEVHFFCDLIYSLYDKNEWLNTQEHP